MSVSLPRLTSASLTAALALVVLAQPSAALAATGEAPGRAAQAAPSLPPTATSDAAGRTGAAGGAAAGRSVGAPAGRPGVAPGDRRAAAGQAAGREALPAQADARARDGRDDRGSSEAGRAAGKARGGDKGAARSHGTSSHGTSSHGTSQAARRTMPAASKAGRSAQPAKSSGDPRGNNGTFKVDGPLLDTSHGNEPQVDCAFRLNFFGYDAGQLAQISFTAIAPTAGSTTTVSGRPVISTSAAQGGLYGGSYPVTGTWTAVDLGLDPTVRQHVKVSVESLNADGSGVPGGAKHKVFWLHPCAAAPVSATTASVPAAAPFVGPVAAPTEATPLAAAVPVSGVETAAATPGAGVLSAGVTAQAAAAPTVVAAPAMDAARAIVLPRGEARSAVRPATLPFTGSPQLLALLLAGIVALVGGTALLVAVRRTA